MEKEPGADKPEERLKSWLKDDERLDNLVKDDLWIIQKPGAFRFAIDSVLLAHFAVVKAGYKVIDLGTGSAVIALLLAAREPEATFLGIDIQPELVDRARRSVGCNGLEDIIAIRRMDIKDTLYFLEHATFDLVISNPPYEPLNSGRISSDPAVALARHELACCFKDIAHSAAGLLKPKGKLAMVYPVKRLPEVMNTLTACGLEPKRLALVYPSQDKEANLFLLEAVKNGKNGLTVQKPLIVYDQPQQYSQDIMDIYFGGKLWI